MASFEGAPAVAAQRNGDDMRGDSTLGFFFSLDACVSYISAEVNAAGVYNCWWQNYRGRKVALHTAESGAVKISAEQRNDIWSATFFISEKVLCKYFEGLRISDLGPALVFRGNFYHTGHTSDLHFYMA